MNEYDKVFNKWKLSGNHGEFHKAVSTDTDTDDPLPFGNFAGGNSSIIYLHSYMVQHPGLVRVLSGK